MKLDWLTLLGSKKLKENIVIIESDDWGSYRYYDKIKSSASFGNSPHCAFDSLETNEDVEVLYDFFFRMRRMFSEDNYPKITLNYVLKSLDYDATLARKTAVLRPFTEIENAKYSWDYIDNILQEGVHNQGFFEVGYHGHVHFNELRFNAAISDKDGLLEYERLKSYDAVNQSGRNIGDALTCNGEKQKLDIINETYKGYCRILDIFDVKSASFIAPRYYMADDLERSLGLVGIRNFQGTMRNIYESRQRIRKIGLNNFTQTYQTVRTIHFEPAYKMNMNAVKRKVRLLSLLDVPLVISTHRLNYVGGFSEENRRRGFLELERFLLYIKDTVPNARFMTSNEYLNEYCYE